jgi:hypothetical protein
MELDVQVICKSTTFLTAQVLVALRYKWFHSVSPAWGVLRSNPLQGGWASWWHLVRPSRVKDDLLFCFF